MLDQFVSAKGPCLNDQNNTSSCIMNSKENIGQHTIFVIISIDFSHFEESSPVPKKQSVRTNLRNGVCETFRKHKI